ncbi:MAG: Hsp33 family molecular chaperone HslO [Oscillospiraceae bacterium]|nr:Hsp33 family molecular chaperone HslO [Oscillospiraceae bacterium]
MSDMIQRAMSTDGWVKAVAIDSRNIVERARTIHGTTPTATAALGRVLSACAMLGNMQKIENGSVTLQIKGGGPLGTLLAVSDAEGNVRGYVQNPHITLLEKYAGKLDVGAAVGTNGLLTVIRDLQMKEPYVGSVELVSGEIGDDVTAYLVQSEQCPSACGLGVLVDVDHSVKAAGGFILQLLPGAPEAIIDRLEAGIAAAGSVTAMLDAGLSLQELLTKVTGGMELEFFEPTPVEYRCYCTRERVEATLISLGRDELTQIAEEGKDVRVECQFCDTPYVFTPDDVRSILTRL